MNDLSVRFVHTDISNMLVLRVAVGLPVRESLKPDGTIILLSLLTLFHLLHRAAVLDASLT